MKIGTIDANGKALVPLTVERLGSEGKRREVTALLDTVFSGFLALPPELIDVLGSEQLRVLRMREGAVNPPALAGRYEPVGSGLLRSEKSNAM